MPANLPSKICEVCGLRFNWRKKWKKNWRDVISAFIAVNNACIYRIHFRSDGSLYTRTT